MRLATEITNKVKEIINENRDFKHITFYQHGGEISMLVTKENNKKQHYPLKYYDNVDKSIKITRKLKRYYGM